MLQRSDLCMRRVRRQILSYSLFGSNYNLLRCSDNELAASKHTSKLSQAGRSSFTSRQGTARLLSHRFVVI